MGSRSFKRAVRVAALLCGALAGGFTSAWGTELPLGFVETVVISDVANVLDFDWDPDGGIWLAGKQGQVWVVREETTLALSLSVDTVSDSGVAALAVDPDYAANGHVWVYYSPPSPSPNRLSRFKNVGDTLTDETIVMEVPGVSSAYNGGCLGFFPDGTVYLTNGMDGSPLDAQDPHSLRGALFRINPDGTAYSENPFVDGVDGDPRVWAYGMRNAFRCSLQPVTNELFLGDVGTHAWEEINIAVAGGNFGYPIVEGPEPEPLVEFVDPFHAWEHVPGQNSAVVAGDFAEPGQFPAEFDGDYFFADHNRKKIFRMQLDGSNAILSIEDFATDAAHPVAVKFGPDGALYYAAWYKDELRRIEYVGPAGAGGEADGLRIGRYGNSTITLFWEPSCNAGDSDYAIFEGSLPEFDVVNAMFCTTNGSRGKTISPGAVDAFYLVVPHNGFWQGSFGDNSDGVVRSMTGSFCLTPQVTPCN